MRAKIKYSIPVFLFLILSLKDVHGQQYRQWAGLEPGPYDVGYTVVQQTDYSRTFGIRTDQSATPELDIQPRPMQINIWYPAQKTDTSERMNYEGYVEWIGTIGKPPVFNEEARNAGIEEFTRYFTSLGSPKEKISQLLNMKTAAIKNGIREKGLFPLVLFAPGIGDSPVMHTVICEYLASHGYIVASVPSMGWMGREMKLTASCIETQTRDLEYVLAFMNEYPFANLHRVGTIGFSLGSCAVLILAMRNTNIDAVVSLDGSIGFKDRLAMVKESPFFNPDNVRIPLLHFNINGNPRNSLGIIDSLHSSLRTIIGIRNIKHMNFTSIGMIAAAIPGFLRSIEPNAKSGYENICRYALSFLDTYIKPGKKGLRFPQNVQQDELLPTGDIGIQIRIPNPTRIR